MIFLFLSLFFISFLGTIYVMPHSIRKLSQAGYLAKDMYKKETPLVPTNAGMILVFTSFISISLMPLLSRIFSFISNLEVNMIDLSEANLAFLLVISIYALYGLVDDLVDIGRILKLVLPVTFSYPLISVINPQTIWVPFFGEKILDDVFLLDITGNDIVRFVIVPIYVMVVANLVNMHSGYNGLQSGLSLIILLTICIKSLYDLKFDNILPVASILGSIAAFYIYNKYPSRVFEGNIGSLFFGSVIGTTIVIQEYWWFGFFILLPHTFNFILWIYWLLMMKRDPSSYLKKNGKHTKFGNIRENGTIKVPNCLTLKWIPNYYFELTEKQTTMYMYSLTILFCSIGLVLF